MSQVGIKMATEINKDLGKVNKDLTALTCDACLLQYNYRCSKSVPNKKKHTKYFGQRVPIML